VIVHHRRPIQLRNGCFDAGLDEQIGGKGEAWEHDGGSSTKAAHTDKESPAVMLPSIDRLSIIDTGSLCNRRPPAPSCFLPQAPNTGANRNAPIHATTHMLAHACLPAPRRL